VAIDSAEKFSDRLANLNGWFGRFKTVVKANRLPLGIMAAVLFIGGTIWSIYVLDIKAADINLVPILAIAGIIIPLTLIYGGLGMMLMARTLGVDIGFLLSIRLSAAALLSEILPVPGGAMVRTAALVSAGGKVKNSAILVTATAVLWISLAAMLTGVLAMMGNGSYGFWLLIGGLATGIPAVVWIQKQAGFATTLLIFIHRVSGLALMVVRLTLAFAIIQIVIAPDAAALFAFASIAGTAAAIAPAGLGVSEAIAAFSASLVSVKPAAAFLAVALNSIVGFAATGIFAMIMELGVGRKDTLESK